jgi:hypothetical protein
MKIELKINILIIINDIEIIKWSILFKRLNLINYDIIKHEWNSILK